MINSDEKTMIEMCAAMTAKATQKPSKEILTENFRWKDFIIASLPECSSASPVYIRAQFINLGEH